ncbi:MAG: class I SAM-dependent methyltransferase [bacterium]|nr:class I SAM-dependent methyltransferase [bacterium]
MIYPSTREYIQSEAIARDYDSYYADLELFQLDTEILDDIIREQGKILDIGCGTGRHTIHFSKKGFDVLGVDLSDHMLEIAKKKIEEQGLRPKLVKADMHNLSWMKERFDYIIVMYSTFGLIKGRALRIKLLKDLFKLLNRDGVLIIHLYKQVFGEALKFLDYKWYLRNIKWLSFDFEPGDFLIKDFRGIKNFYYHRFTLSEVKELFSLAHLRLRKIIYIHRNNQRLAANPLERFLAYSVIVVGERISFQDELAARL